MEKSINFSLPSIAQGNVQGSNPFLYPPHVSNPYLYPPPTPYYQRNRRSRDRDSESESDEERAPRKKIRNKKKMSKAERAKNRKRLGRRYDITQIKKKASFDNLTHLLLEEHHQKNNVEKKRDLQKILAFQFSQIYKWDEKMVFHQLQLILQKDAQNAENLYENFYYISSVFYQMILFLRSQYHEQYGGPYPGIGRAYSSASLILFKGTFNVLYNPKNIVTAYFYKQSSNTLYKGTDIS